LGIETELMFLRFITEPGRCLTEDYGYLISKVEVSKRRNNREILVLNVGSNFIRSINNWYHPVELLDSSLSELEHKKVCDIYGANCFESDLLKLDIQVPHTDDSMVGKKVIIGSAGGYDIPSTNVWTRPLPPIFGIYQDKVCQIRLAQTVSEMRDLQVSLKDLFIDY
jgi:diaminopimelate decarboxylase